MDDHHCIVTEELGDRCADAILKAFRERVPKEQLLSPVAMTMNTNDRLLNLGGVEGYNQAIKAIHKEIDE